MKRIHWVPIAIALVLPVPAFASGIDADATFHQLKTLAGTWQGHAVGEGEAEGSHADKQTVTHRFDVSANGTVVMETMNPGSPHEMINMYTVDGDELILTHYCAGGNQPTMQLDREASTASHLVFDFTGGTNLNPKVDSHIHEAELTLTPSGELLSVWVPYGGGEPVGKMTFELTRVDSAGQ